MEEPKKVFILDVGVTECVCKEQQDSAVLYSLAERALIQNDILRQEVSQIERDKLFYQSIVIQIGNMFGVAAKTADDGTVMESVLVLRFQRL